MSDRENLDNAERVAVELRRLGQRVDVEWPGRVGVHATSNYVFATGENGDWESAVGRVGSDEEGWAHYEGDEEYVHPELPELEGVDTEDAAAVAHALQQAAQRIAQGAPSTNPTPEPDVEPPAPELEAEIDLDPDGG